MTQASPEKDHLRSEGCSFLRGKKYIKARECFEKLLDQGEDDGAVFLNLALAHTMLDDNGAAVALVEEGLAKHPGHGALENIAGLALRNSGGHERAIEYLQNAVLHAGDEREKSRYLANLAACHTDLGDRASTVGLLKQAISASPEEAEAHYLLSELYKYDREEDGQEYIDKLLKLRERGGKDQHENARINFALGNAFDKVRDYRRAWHYYNDANAIVRRHLIYDINQTQENFAALKNAPYAPLPSSMCEKETPTPIFITGLPRSGTSLAEQIIGSHPDVFKGGECLTLSRLQFHSGLLRLRYYDSDYALLDEKQKLDFRKRYFEQVRERAGNARFFTDKTPLNFRFIGFIRDILPEAKIIHCRRTPEDTLLSIFKRHFNSNIPFAYNLEEMASYYNEYISLMDFWQEKYPETVYDLEYEAVTANPEEEIRKLVAYAGTGWDERCLKFYEQKNPVMTASNMQVKEPVYKSSVGAWRKYDFAFEKISGILRD